MVSQYDNFIVPYLLSVNHFLHRYTSAAQLPLMRVLVVIGVQPVVQITPHLFDRPINLTPERGLVRLLQNDFMEAFADAIGVQMVLIGASIPPLATADW